MLFAVVHREIRATAIWRSFVSNVDDTNLLHTVQDKLSLGDVQSKAPGHLPRQLLPVLYALVRNPLGLCPSSQTPPHAVEC